MVATRSSDHKSTPAAPSPSSSNSLALRSRTIQTSTPNSRASTPSASGRKRASLAARAQNDTPRPKRARISASNAESGSNTPSNADSINPIHVTVDIPIATIPRQHKRFGSQEPEAKTDLDTRLDPTPELNSIDDSNSDQADAAPEVESSRRTPAHGRDTRSRTSRSAKKNMSRSQDLTLTTPVSKLKDVAIDPPASASTTRSFQTANETMSDDEQDDTLLAGGVDVSAATEEATDPPFTARHEISDSESMDDTAVIPAESVVDLDNAARSTPTVTANTITLSSANHRITFSDTDDFISLFTSSSAMTATQSPQILAPTTHQAMTLAPSPKQSQIRPRDQPKHNTSVSSLRAKILQKRLSKGTFRVQTSWDRRQHKFTV